MIVQITEGFDGETVAETQVAHEKSACDWIKMWADDNGPSIRADHWGFTRSGDRTVVDFGSYYQFGRIYDEDKEEK